MPNHFKRRWEYLREINIMGWSIVLASWRYYNGEQSSLTDNQYDTACRLICNQSWAKMSPELRKLLGSPEELRSTGYHIRPTSDQVEMAKEIGELLRLFGTDEDDWEQALRFAKGVDPWPKSGYTVRHRVSQERTKHNG